MTMSDAQYQTETRAGQIAEQRRREFRRNVALLGFTFAVFAGLLSYRLLTRTQQTDEARIEGRGIPIAARVAGRVSAVLVRDGQTVMAGQPLVQLETEPLARKLALAEAERTSGTEGVRAARAQLSVVEREARAALSQARGGVLQAGSGLLAANAADQQADATLRAARAQREKLENDYARAYQQSIRDAGTPQANYTSAQATYEAAQALLSAQAAETRAASERATSMAQRSASWGSIVAARGRLEQAKGVDAQLEAARANIALAEARLAEAETRVKLARTDLDEAVIRAPMAGTVGRIATDAGRFTALDQPLMELLVDDDRWVVAQYEGGQIRKMHSGQRAEVTVPALRGRPFKAHVTRVSSDGKVVLRLDDPAEAREVQPNMQASVSVDVTD